MFASKRAMLLNLPRYQSCFSVSRRGFNTYEAKFTSTSLVFLLFLFLRSCEFCPASGFKMASEPPNPVKRERAESGGDLLASLTKEAQHLKEKLDEEKRKLYDAACMLNLSGHPMAMY